MLIYSWIRKWTATMQDNKRKLSDWYIPPDILFIYGLTFIAVPIAVLVSMSLPLLSKAKGTGDATLLYVSLAIGTVGILLLFFARLPLYRERRFFTFGSRALDDHHKRLYRWAYRFIGICVFLLVCLILFLR